MNKRGFASLSKEKLRAIASAGGIAAHAAGTAHRFTSEEAQAAGKLGRKLVRERKSNAQQQTDNTTIHQLQDA